MLIGQNKLKIGIFNQIGEEFLVSEKTLPFMVIFLGPFVTTLSSPYLSNYYYLLK